MTKRKILIIGATCAVILGSFLYYLLLNASHQNKRRIIESNLNTIMSSPKYSSNAQDYLNEHPKEYARIVGMGEFSLKYLLKNFNGNQENGLKQYLMARICCDILQDRNPVNKSWSTGREWYMEYMKTAKLTDKSIYALPNGH